MSSRPLTVSSRSVAPLHVLGAEVRFLCEAESTGGAWSLMEVTLPENSGPPPHVHDWDEAYFVTAGTIEFTVGGERFTASAGDFVYTPGGVAHAAFVAARPRRRRRWCSTRRRTPRASSSASIAKCARSPTTCRR